MSHSETNKPQATACDEYTAAVITVSDRCSRGEREDASGPALVALLGERGYRSYSGYSFFEGRGMGDGLAWTDPAPAGELEPLL